MPALAVSAHRLCDALTRAIGHARRLHKLACGKGGFALDVLVAMSNPPTNQPVPIVGSCPPPESEDEDDADIVLVPYCDKFEDLILWLEELRDIACSIPRDFQIEVPELILEGSRVRLQEALRRRAARPTRPAAARSRSAAKKKTTAKRAAKSSVAKRKAAKRTTAKRAAGRRTTVKSRRRRG